MIDIKPYESFILTDRMKRDLDCTHIFYLTPEEIKQCLEDDKFADELLQLCMRRGGNYEYTSSIHYRRRYNKENPANE